MNHTIRTLLVANRGEIALRIMRTARRMGIQTVAVYSDADAGSPHVRFADKAIRIGTAPARESYLNSAAIVQAALATGADAVHPGYGFLAENADFAQYVLDAGLVFVGPTPESIRAMGNKAAAKRVAMAAGMPCIPGYQGGLVDGDNNDAVLILEAAKIGYPIMVKAAAGGGGRGMRLVQEAADLPAAIASARSEALASFGSDELILERALIAPRHIEIQILADAHGNMVHLGERDCSVQRRHQKVIEEAPSPAVDAALRERMGAVAIAGARAIGYVGAGTMEFLLDSTGAFYFMEMNTRLQVEHAVTEAITNLDLVEWQLRVAAGEALDFAQSDVRFSGHAIEVRLTAEDVSAGFLPQSGPVLLWQPAADCDVRIDHALETGSAVSPHYDSMIAKLVTHGRTRGHALQKLSLALLRTALLGVPTNHGFLLGCLANPVFMQGSEVHTGFIAEQFGAQPQSANPSDHTWTMAALVWLTTQSSSAVVTLTHGSERRTLTPAIESCKLHGDAAQPSISAQLDNRFEQASYVVQGTTIHLAHDGRVWMFEREAEPPLRQGRASAAALTGSVTAPLGARVIEVAVTLGQSVKQGDKLVVLEAMKMEHVLTAPISGTVQKMLISAGNQARRGDVLLVIQ
jgi:geranyl-CoA carboxylase alpha subunit